MSDNEKDPFEGDNTPQPQPVPDEDPAPKKKPQFTKADIKRHFTVRVHMPKLFPDFDPWEFDLRLKLSGEAEERRQEYVSLSPSEREVKLQEQALDEICDLLVSIPRGFGDLTPVEHQNPGTTFRRYIESSDEGQKTILYSIVEGASNLYWQGILPREFRS